MNDREVLIIVEGWRDLLRSVRDVEVDPSAEVEVMRAAVAERQRIIDRIQALDAEVQKTVALRADGWPGVSLETVERAEALIVEGCEIREEILSKDRDVAEKAREIKHELSGEIGKVRKSKGYLASSRALKERPPIIVNSRV